MLLMMLGRYYAQLLPHHDLIYSKSCMQMSTRFLMRQCMNIVTKAVLGGISKADSPT